MKEEALKLADELDTLHQYVPSEAPTMIRELVEEYKKVSETMEKYKKVLEEIANDYPELSHDKARMQNLDHIKWAKNVLKMFACNGFCGEYECKENQANCKRIKK